MAAAVLTGCALFPDDAGAIAINWGIRLPDGYTETYQTDTGASFGGDGLRCHVFTWQDGSDLENLLSWSEDDEETIALVREMLSDLNVPEEDWPSFELDVPEDWPDTSACLSWHGNIREEDPRDQLVILYLPEGATLWVLESFV